MTLENNNSGARNALKGYRLQFLYTLYRILFHTNEEESFAPEGNYEDLDIYDCGGSEIELIQVKALSSRLVLSDILSEKGNSFLRRSLRSYETGISPKIKLISFGEVSDEIGQIATAPMPAASSKKLRKLKLTDRQILILQNHFKHEIVDQEHLVNQINEKLRELTIFSDIQAATDLLTYWIYSTAEKARTINKRTLQEDLLRVAKFQTEQASFYSSYGTLIRPVNSYQSGDRVQLEKDFYQGISASYEHILAGVDIVRTEKLNAIYAKFQESNIVILHGASGQGKSAMAYRYLHDFCDKGTTYSLVVSPDTSTIFQIINTLEGISKGIEFSITLYLDIPPANSAWINILVELSRKKQFNFLLTIREEDWNAVVLKDKVDFKEVMLDFDQQEAERVYHKLNGYRTDLTFLDFADAWSHFGGQGPLLEFVHLITQKESLPEKIRGQLVSIFNEESQGANKLKLLRYVSLCDYYGARIDYLKLVNHLGIDDMVFLIDQLKNEYLLQTDSVGQVIYGLHPIRSGIIRSFLFKERPDLEIQVILDALFVIEETGMEGFLKNSFRNSNLEPTVLFERLKAKKFESWGGYNGVLAALLWKGIDDFVTQNDKVLSDAYAEFQEAWTMAVNADVVHVMKESPVDLYPELFDEGKRKRIREFESRLGSSESIMIYAKTWLSSLSEIAAPANDDLSWNSLSDVLFWINYFRISHIRIAMLLQNDPVLEKIQLQTLAKAHGAIKMIQPDSAILSKINLEFITNLYKAQNLLSIEHKEGGIVKVNYFVNIIDAEKDIDAGNMHKSTMRIIQLLRFAFPDKTRYQAQAFGHMFHLVLGDFDESGKDIASTMLPSRHLTSINSTFINLYTYKIRPSVWQDYVSTVIAVRRYRIEFLKLLLAAFLEFHKKKNYSVLNSYVVEFAKSFRKNAGMVSLLLLPKLALDEWGGVSETEDFEQGTLLSEEKFKASLARYELFREGLKDTGQCIDEFLTQSAFVIHRRCKEFLKQDVSVDKDFSRSSLVGNLFPAAARMKGFQKAFSELFDKYVDSDELKEVERSEMEVLNPLLFIYRYFIYNNKFIDGNVLKLAQTRLSETQDDFKTSTLRAMTKFGRDYGFSVNIDFDLDPGRVVITIEHNDPFKIFESIELLYASLQTLVKDCDQTSLKYFVIDTYFNSFKIIPIVKGRLLNENLQEFMSYSLHSTTFTELKPFLRMPKPIDPVILEELNLQFWKNLSDEILNLEQLWTKTSELYQFANHLEQFWKLDDKILDEEGKETFTAYHGDVVSRFSETWQKCIEGYNDLLLLYMDENNSKLTLEERQNLAFLWSDGKKNLYASDEQFEAGGEEIIIKSEEIQACLPRFEKLIGLTFILYLYLSGRIINSTR